MILNRYFWRLIVLILICGNSCKHREAAPTENPVEHKDLTISPNTAIIGDTIVVNGSSIIKTLRLSVDQGPFLGGSNEFQILLKNETEITAIVPEVHYEKILIKLYPDAYPNVLKKTPPLDSIYYNIAGLIRISPEGAAPNTDYSHIQCVDEKIYMATDGSRVFRSVDAGYHWKEIKEHEGNIPDMFFLNKDQGWISLFTDNLFNGAPGGELIYTNDSGASYKQLIVPGLNDQFITDIFFLNENEGYLLSNKGSIWRTKNNKDFDLIYAFPDRDLSNAKQFSRFFINGKDIITYGRSGLSGDQYVMVTGKNDIFTYKYYDQQIWKVQKTIGTSTFTILDRRLHLSNDFGSSWTKVSDMDLLNVHFFDTKYGIGSTRENVFGDEVIVETRDGGVTWKKIRNLGDFVFSIDMDFSEKSGIIGGVSGYMWKYILY